MSLYQRYINIEKYPLEMILKVFQLSLFYVVCFKVTMVIEQLVYRVITVYIVYRIWQSVISAYSDACINTSSNAGMGTELLMHKI